MALSGGPAAREEVVAHRTVRRLENVSAEASNEWAGALVEICQLIRTFSWWDMTGHKRGGRANPRLHSECRGRINDMLCWRRRTPIPCCC